MLAQKKLSNKNVINCLLNTVSECAEVTLAGSLFMQSYLIALYAIIQDSVDCSMRVPPSYGTNGRQSCEVVFAA